MDTIEYMRQFIAPDEVIEDLIAEMEFIAENLPDTFIMDNSWIDTDVKRHRYYCEG